MKRVLFILGTRPEAIKLCPVIRCLREAPDRFEVRILATAQHRSMLDQVLDFFGMRPDYDLDVMRPGQMLAESTARILAAIDPILAAERFDFVVVQGDTTTTMTGALAAFYRQVPVAHVEAGLRSGDLANPFPEEFNRLVASRLAALHFAPTEGARRNLLAEGVPERQIHITGNSGIDAVLHIARELDRGGIVPPQWPWLDENRRLILVTAHRRESFGDGIRRICDALAGLAARGDVQVVYPVHRNPNILGPVTERLAGRPNVFLLEPLEYPAFVDLMRRAYLLITDSGGIQEEAPAFGKPVLVMRESTERPEGVEAGTARLVGRDPERIQAETAALLDDPEAYQRMAKAHNPYGDGRASQRIREILDRS